MAVGLFALLQIALPGWYLVPGALLHMTGQNVALGDPLLTGADVPAEDQPQPAPEATPAPLPTPVGPVPTVAPTPTDAPALPPTGPLSLLPNRRFNVLLLGSDNDLKFAPNAVLTQSMILISIDPSTNNVAMISIPRDFWVRIQGYGYQKIDVAYEVGGIAVARATVQSLFGVKVDYYAWVGLNGLVQVIDMLGGVNVTVQHPVLDETYPDDLNPGDPYAFFRLYIPAGPQHLDGTTALEYVRSRHGDLQSDFGRSARQQQVLLALKSRMQDPGMIQRMPQLVNGLQDAVKTDLPLPALAQLALLGTRVGPSNIHQLVLQAPQYASLGNSPDGTEQVVFPDWTAIHSAIARLIP